MAKKKKIVGIIGVNGEKQDLTKANEITQKLPKAPNIVGSVDVDGNITKYNQQVNPINSENKKLVITPILTEEQKRQQAMEQSKVMREPMEVSMMKNNINNQIAKNIVSGGIQNDIHNMNMIQAGKSSLDKKIDLSGKDKLGKTTPVDISDFIYNDTGKKYGDYYYDNYELYKDMPIYEQKGKYYLKTNRGYEPIGRLDKNGNVIENLMTNEEAERKDLEKAQKLGYKDNLTKITTQDYDDAQETFKKLQKEYKLSDKELNDWLKTGDLDLSHISLQTNSMSNLRNKAEDYREKINSGKIKQYDQQGFGIENQIYLDTQNLSDIEKQQYISYITGKKDKTQKNNNTFFKGSSVFDDGYQFGDVTKATLGTVGNAGISLAKGVGKFVEGTGDFATNLVGSGLELMASDKDKKDVKEFHNNTWNIGYKYGNKNYWYDDKNDRLYDENWNRVYNFDINKMQKRYTYANGVAEFGRQMKEQTVNDDTSEVFDEILHGNDLRKMSVLGNKSESMLESLGQAIPLMAAGGSVGGLYGESAAVATTSGLTFTSTYGKAKEEAIRNGASEKEAMQTAFVQATAETISEQFFDAIPGAKSAGWGEKLVGKIGKGVENYFGSTTGKIVMKALDISGEGFEEVISNMLTAGGNDIVHFFDKDYSYGMENQTGNILDDMSKAMVSQDSMDSFISAIITSAILNGGSAKVNSAKINKIVKAYAQEYNMSFDEAKARLKISDNNIEFDTSNINQTQNTPNLPNKSVVEQRNINNNINNQVSDNVQNSMATMQNNNISENINNQQNNQLKNLIEPQKINYSKNVNDRIDLEDYDFKTEQVIKSAERNVIVRNYRQLDTLIDEALDTQSNKALHFGRINETITQRIKRKLENLPKMKAPYLTKEKYDLVMNQSEIRHLIDEKTMMTREDVHKYVGVLPEIISNFDSASYSIEPDSEGIRFKKKLPDGNYISFVLVSNKQSTLKAKSIHLDKIDYETKKRSISPTNDVLKTPDRTSETDGAFASMKADGVESGDIMSSDINVQDDTSVAFLDNNNTTTSPKSQIAPLPQYNMQQNTKNDTTKVKPPIAKEYQKNTIEEKIENSSIKSINNATKIANKYLDLSKEERQLFQEKLKKYKNKTYEEISNGEVYNEIKDIVREFSIRPIENIDEEMKSVKREIRNRNIKIDDNLKNQIDDYNEFRKSMFGKLKLTKDGMSIDSLYNELSNIYPYYFDSNITTEADMLYELADFMDKNVVDIQRYNLTEKEIDDCTSKVFNEMKNGLMTDEKINSIKEKNDKKENKLTHKEVKEQLLNDMNITAEDLSVGDDIKSLNFQLTDPIRVNEKVFGRELGKKVNEVTIEKTKHNEAERTRWLNSERDDIKELEIKPRSKESAAVQKYGEKQYVNKYGETVEYGDKELMAEFPNIKTQEKIKRASQMIRNKYDKYIDQINETLTALGYDEIPKRPDYMRHFQELGDIFSQTGVPFNLNDMSAEDLPTDINGLTEFNKPGKNWFASAQKRYGNKTTYDAITGIDGYLEGASNLIFHTEDIQRYRALSGLIRDSFGKTKGFENLDNLSNKEALKRIDDIQHNKLSKYVAWLDEQANSLANKKGAIDRGTERILGRRGYTALNTIKKQVGSNMTGFNVRSAMTNFISSTIAASKTNKIAMIKGTISTIRNMFHNDGFINKSDFLTSRFGSDSLSPKLWNKISNAGQILMKGSDYFTSNQIVRSKYYEGLQRGMTETEAIKYADDFGSRVMGDRSKGATAEAFNSKTLGLLTQFQLETNNQWQFMVHDSIMDYEANSKINGGLKAGATMLFQLGQLCAYSYFFNEFFEALTGSRAAFDPIDILLKLLGWGDDDKDKSFEQRMKEANSELVDAIPFASLFGKGGRMPISEALVPFETTYDYLTGKKNSYGGNVTLEDVKNDTLSTLPYYLLPTGYSQIKKTTKGLSMFNNNKEIKGSYTKSGRLRFPVKDTIGNKIQAGLFGEYASKEAREYFNQNRKPLTDNQQNIYKYLDIPISDYWKINKDINNLKSELKGKDVSKRQEEIFDYIDNLDISQPRKDILKKLQYKSYKDGDNRIIKYINSSNMSTEAKKEILKKLGLDK